MTEIENNSKLRQDLMDAIGRYRDENRENALAQTRATQEGGQYGFALRDTSRHG
jgi:hypothetical protein